MGIAYYRIFISHRNYNVAPNSKVNRKVKNENTIIGEAKLKFASNTKHLQLKEGLCN